MKKSKVERSKKLADFTYNELCLNMDINYGFKELKNINSFDNFFEVNGIKDKLLSLDSSISSKTLSEFLTFYIDDLHSTFVLNSPYTSTSVSEHVRSGAMEQGYSSYLQEFVNAFNACFNQEHSNLGLPWYKEEGDTCFIYFNSFNISAKDMSFYYNTDLKKPENEFWWVEKNDTLGLIQYAHSQITRPNSPIKNVVVDLSINVGGYVDAGAYILSWLIGTSNSGLRVHTQDSFTKALASTYVLADINLDGAFDSKDYLHSYGIKPYILTSPLSFSCGNLVPALAKSSGRATIIGQTTIGGACGVLPSCLADGTFLISQDLLFFALIKMESVITLIKVLSLIFILTISRSFILQK